MCLRLSKCRKKHSGTRMIMKRLIQIRPESVHAGGVVDDKSWYSAVTTLGIRPLMIMR